MDTPAPFKEKKDEDPKTLFEQLTECVAVVLEKAPKMHALVLTSAARLATTCASLSGMGAAGAAAISTEQ